MKKTYKNIMIIGVGLVALTACTGDLNTEPLTPTTVLPEMAWAADDSYEAYVAKVYASFATPGDGPGNSAGNDIVGADQGEAMFTRSYWNLQELPTDESTMAWSDESLNGLQFNQWVSTNRFIMLNYDRLCLNNTFCNEFLIQTSDSKVTGRGHGDKLEAVHQYRAEIRALRALSYYILMDLYGNVPFVDENSGIGAYLPEQKGRDFLFPWIENELKSVIDNLPQKSPSTYGMVNRYVVDMILAKLYMNAEVYGQGNHYADAVTYLNDIIDNGGYSLEPTYKFNFQADNHLSPEMIFPIIYDGVYVQGYGGTTYLTHAAYSGDMNSGVNFGLPGGWDGIRAPKDLSALFEDGDSRALFWTEDRTQDIQNWGDFKQGYSVVKYTNLTRDGQPGSDQTFADTDFPFYRLADAYLLYVEAAMHGAGDAAKAVRLYNQVQERAFGNTSHNIQSLSDISFSELLDERARELYWEGHRRTDLIRFNSFVDGKSWTWKGGTYLGTAKIDKKYLLFPLPSTDISANSNLKQNEGYGQ